jgi:hypothetical protein
MPFAVLARVLPVIRTLTRFDGEDDVHGRDSRATACGRSLEPPAITWRGEDGAEVTCDACREALLAPE